jgi:multidrug resistance efflux pump
MAETEVESILREIRERVLSEQRTGKEGAVTRSAMANGGNGAGVSAALQQTINDDNETLTIEKLSLIQSHLTTTARAWDRLPPLVSNRSGLIARVELWLKRQLKRATHWFTWEQVNFNAAVHQSLRELLPVIAAHEHELQALRAQVADQRQAAETQLTQLEALNARTETRVDGLARELNERDAHLRDEQRVCFKQLALETSEAAVLEDRARRKAEALLEELRRRVDQLETGQK